LVQAALGKTWRHWSRIAERGEGAYDAYVRRVMMTTYIAWWLDGGMGSTPPRFRLGLARLAPSRLVGGHTGSHRLPDVGPTGRCRGLRWTPRGPGLHGERAMSTTAGSLPTSTRTRAAAAGSSSSGTTRLWPSSAGNLSAGCRNPGPTVRPSSGSNHLRPTPRWRRAPSSRKRRCACILCPGRSPRCRFRGGPWAARWTLMTWRDSTPSSSHTARSAGDRREGAGGRPLTGSRSSVRRPRVARTSSCE
jgi:hypothetical protein